MVKPSPLLLLFIASIICFSCEKDDICVEGDTPLLVIEFYDTADTTVLKSVTALRIAGLGQTTTINTFMDRSTVNTVSIPLKTDVDTTSFILISNSANGTDDIETGNIDTLNFSYSRSEKFLSRGCGFVINYENLNADIIPDPDNWIKGIAIERPQVINSDSTHVKIFH